MESIVKMLPALWDGAQFNLALFGITLVLSIPFGFFLALMRMSKSCWLSQTVNGYIWLMRGTPLMLQLMFIYFGLPLINLPALPFTGGEHLSIRLDPFSAAVIAFVLNYAAYFAEIFRAGIQSINKGQYEAAYTLGFTPAQTMRKIILPQVVKRILPPLGNETITLIKDTALVFVISIFEILRTTQSVVNREVTLFPYLIAAVFFLSMTFVLTWMFQRLEKHYAVYDD